MLALSEGLKWSPLKVNIKNCDHFMANDKIEGFNGVLLHPSLDIKDGLLVLGFRYRLSSKEEKNVFLVAKNTGIEMTHSDSFEWSNKTFFFENKGRMLNRLDERWGVAELQQFLDNQATSQDESPRQVFERIRELLSRYLELEKDTDYNLIAAWIIGTYLFPIFYAYPFLNIKAPKRSGKSQLLNILSQLCFNAVKARPSLAALGDTVDSLRGTVLLDQADSLDRKESLELLDILADSYKKIGGKRRVITFDKGKNRTVQEFETYSPKAFASIKEIPEDLRDRCLIIPLIRSSKNFLDPDDGNENWRQIRGLLYKLAISHYQIISTTYAVRKIEYKEKQDILGRTLELWLPFEVILEVTGMADIISEAKKRFLSGYGFAEYEPSVVEEAVIVKLRDILDENSSHILSPKQISEQLDSDIFGGDATSQQRAAKVGWAIKKFNLASEKRPRTKDGVCYLFEKIKIETIYNSYFKKAIEPTSTTLEPPSG